MSQRIAIDCDMHQLRDEVVSGEPYDLAVRVAGGAFKFITIDLCEDCAKPLQDVFSEVAEVGRAFTGDPTTIVRTAAAKASRTTTAKTNRPPEVCPVCQSEHSTKTALRNHVRMTHDMTMAEASGVPDEDQLHCDVCNRGFLRPQGLGTHRRIAHPDAPPKTVGQIRDEARAGG